MNTVIDQLCLTGFVLCGLARLARFNVTAALLPKDATGKSKYFEGLPIPTSLAEVALISYWLHLSSINAPLNFPKSVSQKFTGLPGGTILNDTNNIFDMHWVTLIFVIHGCLLVSKSLKVPKP